MSEPIHCQYCHDGAAPTTGHIRQEGKRHYVCLDCGRDVTQALFWKVDFMTKIALQLQKGEVVI